MNIQTLTEAPLSVFNVYGVPIQM